MVVYGKLPIFYCNCGGVGHGEATCNSRANNRKLDQARMVPPAQTVQQKIPAVQAMQLDGTR